MNFLSDGREVQLRVAWPKGRATKDGERLVILSMAMPLSHETAEALPGPLQIGWNIARNVDCGATLIDWDLKVESQTVTFAAIPGGAKQFTLQGVDLEQFEIEKREDSFWLWFTVETMLGRELWDFLFAAVYRDVWATFAECQQDLRLSKEAAPRSSGATVAEQICTPENAARIEKEMRAQGYDVRVSCVSPKPADKAHRKHPGEPASRRRASGKAKAAGAGKS